MKKFWFTVLMVTTAGFAAQASDAVAVLKDAAGKQVGLVEFDESDQGVLVDMEVDGVAPGWHAIHVHEKDDCSGEGFKSAGGHAVGPQGHTHGFLSNHGRHAGDMPNVWANEKGEGRAQAFLAGVKISDWLDEDGAAVILHAKQDDYSSQPSGNAGARVACGSVIQ